ncbi:hypothetical protein PQX77_003096 [Marasmius sp. AFHP31]|nr:hypothetical protein PQX77_003096 [Marasmius sp. AFHP31]
MTRCTVSQCLGLTVVSSTLTLEPSYRRPIPQTLSHPTTSGLEISSSLNTGHAGTLSGGWSGYLMGLESVRKPGHERDVFVTQPSSTQLSSAPMKCRGDAILHIAAASPHMFTSLTFQTTHTDDSGNADPHQLSTHGYTHKTISTTPPDLVKLSTHHPFLTFHTVNPRTR